MSYSNYRDIEQAIAQLEPFNGNSASAYLEKGEYIIVSYSTEMARIRVIDREVMTFNDNHYSSTTSRLQNIIRREFDITK